MKIPRKPALAALAVLGLFSVIVMVQPFMAGHHEGELTVRWSSPKGLILKNLVKGDTIDLSYESELPLSVYLLSPDLAANFRSPSFHKDELPPSILKGSSGSIRLKVNISGDRELLFWNSSFTTDQTVEYTIKMHRMVLTWLMLVSGAGLLLLCLGGAIILIRRGDKDIMQ